jgi:hypothetical protein
MIINKKMEAHSPDHILKPNNKMKIRNQERCVMWVPGGQDKGRGKGRGWREKGKEEVGLQGRGSTYRQYSNHVPVTCSNAISVYHW